VRWNDIGFKSHPRRFQLHPGGFVQKIEPQIWNQDALTDVQGKNPFELVYLEQNGMKTYFSQLYPTYDWISQNGNRNFADWIEAAAPKDSG